LTTIPILPPRRHSRPHDESIKVAYSHRIERPDYGDLNPFYNISDPHNISTGNPGLRPEKGYRYELGYNHKFTGGSVYVGAFFRRNTDDIQSVSTYYATLDIGGVTYTDVTLGQRYNIGSQSSIGANIFGSLAVTNAFSLRTNIQLGSLTNESVGLGKSTGFVFRGNLRYLDIIR
jgi:outer membrane receptor protein involved in Fe transport